MTDVSSWVYDAIAGISWLEVVKALAPVATACIAFAALKNWQRQDKAKREAEFLDQLIDATHAFIAQMPTAVTLLEIAEIGMKSHAQNRGEEDQAVNGAITYIHANGDVEAKRLRDALDSVRPSVVRLRSLAAKGQIFKLANYAKCHNAVAELTWQFDRVEAFTAVVGLSSCNWEHPTVLQNLKNIMAISPEDIRARIETSHVVILEFSREAYGNIYC